MVAQVRSRQSATRIVLARHGEAAYLGGVGGGGDGGVLTEAGRVQARTLGESLRSASLAAVYSSELPRARQTADIAGELLRLPVETRDGLQEYQLGAASAGLEDLEAALLAWLAGDLQIRVPGGENGAEIGRRMFSALEDVAGRHEGRTTLVVSHGGAIIATLGTIAPRRTGLLAHDDGHLREQDIPGGASFLLEHDSHGWHFLGRG